LPSQPKLVLINTDPGGLEVSVDDDDDDDDDDDAQICKARPK